MEAKASIQIGHVNNLEKQKVSLTFYVGPFDNVEEAQSCKYALDAIAEAYGATIYEQTRIIGEALDTEAKEQAEQIVKENEESNNN